jgi:UDP-N-acetylglucosamine 2-epimerase (non-hydrolysing)
MFIFGTRPEAIKLAPVIREMSGRQDAAAFQVCVTAQHRELLDQVIRLFKIPVHFDLQIMRPNQDLFRLSRRALKRVGRLLTEQKPDMVLVQGDTTTAFISTLASFYLRIPVSHIEAGLRTEDLYNPFPEEANRRLISTLAERHYCPTEMARKRLLEENVPPGRMVVTGNTVVDALMMIRSEIERIDPAERFPRIDFSKKILLVTSHRREKFGAVFENICRALRRIAADRRDVQIIYPVHPNPNIRNPAYERLQNQENIHLTDPLDYLDFLALMKASYGILTDSGGVQEEAPSLTVPVLVMRENTERMEAVACGASRLVGVAVEPIVEAVCELLDNGILHASMKNAGNPYGDGTAARRIVRDLTAYLGGREHDTP